jgi:hypothetical protein
MFPFVPYGQGQAKVCESKRKRTLFLIVKFFTRQKSGFLEQRSNISHRTEHASGFISTNPTPRLLLPYLLSRRNIFAAKLPGLCVSLPEVHYTRMENYSPWTTLLFSSCDLRYFAYVTGLDCPLTANLLGTVCHTAVHCASQKLLSSALRLVFTN